MRALPLILAVLAAGGCRDDDPPDDEGGVEFQPVALDDQQGAVLLASWSDGPDLLMVGGVLSSAPGVEPGGAASLVRIRDGEACAEANVADRPLWWIHGPGPGEWYATGERGLIVHDQDGTRTDESVDTQGTLYGVWSPAGKDPIAVGGDPFNGNVGEVWRREDGSWVALAEGLESTAFKIWEDWIVGDGVAWQLEGDTLVEHHPPDGAKLLTIRGRAPDDVWAVGGFASPVMLHWDGSDWSEVDVDPECATNGLNGVWTGPDEDVWIAGFFGGLGAYDGESWRCPKNAVTAQHFHAVWEHEGEIWWSGGNLLSPGGDLGTVAATTRDVLPDEIKPCD